VLIFFFVETLKDMLYDMLSNEDSEDVLLMKSLVVRTNALVCILSNQILQSLTYRWLVNW
jgi:hypothetical protein